MNERFTAFLFVTLFLLAGCAAGGRSPRVSSSASPADRAARIEEHFDRLEAQVARVERLQRRAPHVASLPRQPSIDLRARFAAYRQADRQQRTFFAAHGISLDSAYYRLQHQLLDAFSAQLQQLEELLTQIRNDRSA